MKAKHKYPSQLPFPLRDGYQLNSIDPMKETQMLTGRSRFRRNYSSVPENVEVRWLLTGLECQSFRSWHEEVLISGSEWFECELRSDQGLLPYTAHFRGMYKGPELFGVDHWIITATLQLWKRSILTGGWAVYAPEYILGMNLLDLAINKDWPQ